ncbi:MAG: hypothetical protein AAB955_00155 [Patescibacteria group bacterium]
MEKIVFITAGLISTYFSGRCFFDMEFAKKYAAESPKTYLLRTLFSHEKTLTALRYFFAPLGVLLGIILVVYGLLL